MRTGFMAEHVTGASGQGPRGAWPQEDAAQGAVTDTLQPQLDTLSQTDMDGLRPLAMELILRVPGAASLGQWRQGWL